MSRNKVPGLIPFIKSFLCQHKWEIKKSEKFHLIKSYTGPYEMTVLTMGCPKCGKEELVYEDAIE